MALKDTIRNGLKQHPKVLNAALVLSFYGVQLLVETSSNSANNGP